MLMIAAVNVVVGATSAAAVKGTITVTPSTGLVGSVGTWKQGTTVTINGSGWAPNAEVGWCQGVPSVGAPSDSYCGTGHDHVRDRRCDRPASPVRSSLLATSSIPALGRSVDCGNPAVKCVIGAGDRSDVADTGLCGQPEVRSDTSHCDPRHCHRRRGQQRSDHRDRAGHPHGATRSRRSWWRGTTMFVPGALVPQATPGTDYTATSGNVTFASGQTRTTLNITVTGDTVVERKRVHHGGVPRPQQQRVVGRLPRDGLRRHRER